MLSLSDGSVGVAVGAPDGSHRSDSLMPVAPLRGSSTTFVPVTQPVVVERQPEVEQLAWLIDEKSTNSVIAAVGGVVYNYFIL